MFERLAYSLITFIWYFTPLYLFMLNTLNQKFKWHTELDKIFSKFSIAVAVPLVSYLFVVFSVWGQYSIIFWFLYLTFFFLMFYYLSDQISVFQAFVISSLCVFAISEIWELPIKLNNLISSEPDWFGITFTSMLKMSSIPMLIYLAKIWKWHITQDQKDLLIIGGGFLTLLLLNTLMSSVPVDFLYGIFLRIMTGIVIAYSVIGFQSRNEKGI